MARFLAGLARQAQRHGALLEPAVVNGSPGLRVLDPAGRLVNVLAMDFRDGRVAEVRSIVNPDKMQHLGPVASAAELLGSASAGRERQVDRGHVLLAVAGPDGPAVRGDQPGQHVVGDRHARGRRPGSARRP